MKKLLLWLMLLCTAAAHANEAYVVELIVFENLDPAVMRAETWRADPGTPALDQALELVTAAQQAPWRLLAPAQLELGGLFQRLRSAARYRPLLHVGWVQPAEGSDRSAPVHVFSGMTGDGAIPSAAAPVDGTVAVRRSRFLHADIDLLLRKTAVAGAAPLTVRLNGTRRLRSNELHYLDHPLFGVIIRVSAAEGGASRIQ